jgi:hypothetical protein
MGDPLTRVGCSVAGVVRASLHLPFLPQSIRLVVVKLIPSSGVAVRPHRWWRTVTGPSPAAAHDDEPLPLQPKPSYLQESRRRVTGNTWVGSVSRASSPPTSLSSRLAAPLLPSHCHQVPPGRCHARGRDGQRRPRAVGPRRHTRPA